MKILAYRTLEQEKVVKKVLGYKKPETPATIP